MRPDALARQIFLLRVVPPSTQAVTVLASAVGLFLALSVRWPLWALNPRNQRFSRRRGEPAGPVIDSSKRDRPFDRGIPT